jgi:hypothetical protein
MAALHVSSDTFTHHQELLNCIYSLWYYTCELLPAGFMGEFQPFLKLMGEFQPFLELMGEFQLPETHGRVPTLPDTHGRASTLPETGQQHLTCIIPEAVNTVYKLLMMSESIA